MGPEKAACQEVVHRAEDPDFDLRTLLPAPTNTPIDAGPYFCLGLLLGSDPEEGTDVTIHRMCVQGRDELSIFFAPSRHIDAFRAKAEALGKGLPVSVNMGLDPAIFLSTSFEAPNTPYGFDELTVAGAIRGRGIELAKCLTVDQRCIAGAEVVIEGEILPNVRVPEDQNSHTGHAMPEFPGYVGPAHPALPVLKITAVTHRKNPILQTLVGPGEEHTTLAGIPTEASIYNLCQKAMPGFVSAVYAHSAGGGKFLAVMQCNKKKAFDDGRARYAALVALAAYPELKNVILVDEDVDVFDSDDVLWAMQTRMQGDLDIINIPGVAGHVLDPSQTPQYNPRLPAVGRHEQDHLRLHGAVPPARRVRPRPVPGRRPDTLALTPIHSPPTSGRMRCRRRRCYEAPAVASKMLVAAMGLIETLDVEPAGHLVLPLDDPRRQDWDIIPRPEGTGLSLHDLSRSQKILVWDLLAAALPRAHVHPGHPDARSSSTCCGTTRPTSWAGPRGVAGPEQLLRHHLRPARVRGHLRRPVLRPPPGHQPDRDQGALDHRRALGDGPAAGGLRRHQQAAARRGAAGFAIVNSLSDDKLSQGADPPGLPGRLRHPLRAPYRRGRVPRRDRPRACRSTG